MFFVLLDLFFISVPKWIYISNGILLLMSMDMIYKPAQVNWKIKLHSEQTFLIALTIFFLINNMIILTLIMYGFRLILYFLQSKSITQVIPLTKILYFLRIIFLMTSGLWLLFQEPNPWIIILFLLGEFIGRISFYFQLHIPKVSELLKKS